MNKLIFTAFCDILMPRQPVVTVGEPQHNASYCSLQYSLDKGAILQPS